MNIPINIKEVAADLIKCSGEMRKHIDKVNVVKPYITALANNGVISETDFYNISSFLTPQSRSPLWQNYFIAKVGADKVKAKDDRGDLLWNGKFYKYKISGFNADSNLHIIQVRLWQNCDYVIQYVSSTYNPPITFILEHRQMKDELNTLKATAAHGTRKANKDNTNIELRCSVKLNGDDWDRWQDCYKKDIFGGVKIYNPGKKE